MFADRFGNRRSLIIFFVGTGAGALLASFSNTGTSIMYSLAFIGFFSSIYHPAGMGLISIGTKNRGMALGINGVAGNLGLMSAPFVAGILNWLVGWQITYQLVGIICIAWGLGMVLVNIDETPLDDDERAEKNAHNHNNDTMKYFLILCIVMTLAGLAYRANIVVLPAYFEYNAGFLWDYLKEFHFSNLEGAKTMAATLLASSVFIVSAMGQIVGGKLADKYDLRWMYLAFHLLSLPFVILMGIFSQQLLVISAALYVFFALGMQPIENSLVAKFTPNRWRSTGFGIKFILVFGIGSIAVYVVGWIKKAWDLGTVYFFSGAIIGVMVLFIVLLIVISRKVSCRNLA
jgi:MFS family permease